MRKSTLNWIKALFWDGGTIALFILWKQYGYEGAGNVVLGYLWFTSVIWFLGSFLLDKKMVDEQPKQTWLRRSYRFVLRIGMLTALAWYGYFALAFFFIISRAMFDGRRVKIERDVAAEGAAA